MQIGENTWEYAVGSDNWSPLTQIWQVDLPKPLAARAKIHLGWYCERASSSPYFLVGIMKIKKQKPGGIVSEEIFGNTANNLNWRLNYYNDYLLGVTFAATTSDCFGRVMLEMDYWEKTINLSQLAQDFNFFFPKDEDSEKGVSRALTFYDSKTGQIDHVHHEIKIGGGQPDSSAEIEKKAIETAKLLGKDLSRFSTLFVPEFSQPRSIHRVDVSKKRLLEVPFPDIKALANLKSPIKRRPGA